MPKQRPRRHIPLLERITPLPKFLACLLLSVAAYYIAGPVIHVPLARILLAWDIFSVCMIGMNWATFFIVPSGKIREQAKVQDPKGSVVFIIVLVCTLASILAVLLLIISKNSGAAASGNLPVAIAGMLFSWILVHTIFTLRYAHMYYSDHRTKPGTHAGGLEFPGDEKPEYPDFAYFSFVIGMTFQVSDVQITSGRLRKLALLHGLLSFVFNTIMIALTINLIAGFGS